MFSTRQTSSTAGPCSISRVRPYCCNGLIFLVMLMVDQTLRSYQKCGATRVDLPTLKPISQQWVDLFSGESTLYRIFLKM